MVIRFSIRGSTLGGILCLFAAAALIAALAFTAVPAAQAAPLPDDPVENPLAPDDWVGRDCSIDRLRADEDVVRVDCNTPGPGGVYFFVIPNDALHRDVANRVLVIANTAYALGQGVRIIYDTDTSALPPGYPSTSSRLLAGIYIDTP